MTTPERLTYTVPEAAKALGIGTTKCWEAVHTGEIRSVRIGKRVLIPRRALLELLGEEESAA